MARRNKNKGADRGRDFYETSSPFETFVPGGPTPKSFTGLVDETPMPGKLNEHLSGDEIMGKMQPEQYDNPRGYPGMALVTRGSEKAKLPFSASQHSITHHMEGGANMARTGKR